LHKPPQTREKEVLFKVGKLKKDVKEEKYGKKKRKKAEHIRERQAQ
jgi:hypothetical protein